MDYTSSTKRAQTRAWDTYAPPIDEVLSPPPSPTPADERHSQQPDNGSLGRVITWANGCVAIIIVGGMLLDGQQVRAAIITGALYFAITTILYMFVITGALSSIIAVWQHERTERARIDAYADIASEALHWRLTVEQTRALELQAHQPPPPQLPAHPPQTPSRLPTFVPAYADAQATAREAIAWAESLYLPNGRPDPRKVQTTGDNVGWLLVRAIGSKRSGGSEDAALWLRQRKFLRRVRGGALINLQSYPTREHLRALR